MTSPWSASNGSDIQATCHKSLYSNKEDTGFQVKSDRSDIDM